MRLAAFLRRTVANQEVSLLFCFGLMCLTLWAFVATAGESREIEHAPVEAKIMRSFRRANDPASLVGPSWLAPLARTISAAGGPTMTISIVVLAAIILVAKGQKVNAGLFIAVVLGGSVLNWSLKHAFNRPRPTVVPYLSEPSGSSFPSGHSLTSAMVYITLTALIAHSLSNWKSKVSIVTLGLLLSCLVGVSRVMLGVHYPTDVLAGWAAGAFWALACWIAAEFLRERGKPSKPRVAAATGVIQ